MRLLFVAAALLLIGCPQPQTNGGCNADNCAGCCEPSGKCQLGQSMNRCGANGNSCSQCGVGLNCVLGTCSANGAGGSSGVGGGGGGGVGGGSSGTGGGGTGTTGQELVSGTRLRAVNFTGVDGSRAPYVFFDNTLMTYCQAGLTFAGIPASAGPRCYPLIIATNSLSETQLFLDAQCSSPAYAVVPGYDLSSIVTDAGLPAGTVVVYNVDGGFNVGAAVTQPVFRLVTPADGGCAQAPAGPRYVSAGMLLPPSAFAPMPLVRE